LICQHHGVARGDQDLGERRWRNSQCAAKPVDAFDDELGQRLDDL